jgi:peroxiredoxin Q/BCP
VVAVLFGIFATSHSGTTNKANSAAFQVGSPGPGQPAPPIRLASTTGGTFDLAAQQGQTTLLYFQEGLTCQPCWDQLKAIQSDLGSFKALGISQVVSITSDPLGGLQQKVSDEGITGPVLSDPNLSVSSSYSANQYGMMGNSRDGHSFIAVGPNGVIRWRADYGGAPNYTMNVPVPQLLTDLRAGLAKAG